MAFYLMSEDGNVYKVVSNKSCDVFSKWTWQCTLLAAEHIVSKVLKQNAIVFPPSSAKPSLGDTIGVSLTHSFHRRGLGLSGVGRTLS